MFKSIVNNDISTEINLAELDWDLLQLDTNKFHIIQGTKSYLAEVVAANYQDKTFDIQINDNTYTVQVKDKFDLLVDKMGLSVIAAQKMNNIKAPMPGLVLDISVAVGDTVQKGDPVLILEAMKMENVIKADGEATVKEIIIKKGTAVEKNQILVEFE